MDEADSTFDFIVCGSGSSGSVVARRLAENRHVNVLLIEAGGRNDVDEVRDAAKALANLGSQRDWGYEMAANPHIDGRTLPLPAGKVLGGGSSVNFMYWARGHKSDWDNFALQAADPAWGFDAVRRIYGNIERWRGTGEPARDTSRGIIPITQDSSASALGNAASEAFERSGMPRYESLNGSLMEESVGYSNSERTVVDGQRVSVFTAYLQDYLTAPNLTVLTETLVQSVTIEGNRATGVSVIKDGRSRQFKARHEVILSTGAIQTPKILMLSGIGNEAELRRHGIVIRQHLPGVGQNYQDHPLVLGCNWLAPEGAFEIQPASLVGFCNSLGTNSAPNLHIVFSGFMTATPLVAQRYRYPAGNFVFPGGWGMGIGLLRPESRGRITLADANPNSKPIIDARMLSEPRDREALLAAIEMARSIGNSGPLKRFTTGELSPRLSAVEERNSFLRDAIGTYFHPTSTAKMGTDDLSVVGANLAVHGMEGLRIADASIMPRIPAANTMGPSVIVGERASNMIKAAHGL
ncbi:MAG: Choline dehydrogenase [Bradyrhizobium sp.]|jgi:choline dehydrogenase|nr:Choline dehydrogenase [Bradyrhizobium sp.]